MTRLELLDEINSALQVETEMTENTKLADVEEWDSLALVSVLALFSRKLGFRPDISLLRNAKTASDLLDLAENRAEK